VQNISSLALILWEILKKGDESWLSLLKFQQFFNPISAPGQKFKNLIGRSVYKIKLREKFEDDGQTYCKNAKFQTAPYGTNSLLMIFAELPLSLPPRWISLKIETFTVSS